MKIHPLRHGVTFHPSLGKKVMKIHVDILSPFVYFVSHKCLHI